MPLTENGFQRLTYDEILEDKIGLAKILFGDDIDTSDQSVFGKILRLFCLDAAMNQELAENVYLSAFPNTAQGVSLDRLTPLAGISRNPATYAEQEITITGTPDAVIPMGFLVAAGDIVFHTVDNYTIGSGGTVEAIVQCNEAGTIGNVAIGSINSIVNPSADVTSIEHTGTVSLGSEAETDYELRTRFATAISGIGSGTLSAIRGAILRVSGVETVLIEENATNETVNGIPPHSFLCYVLAPTSTLQSVAEAIFSKKPVGISTTGDVSATVTDESGNQHTISFSWTEQVNVYVSCDVSLESGAVSEEVIAAIKSAVVNKLSTYTNGQNVTATSLYAPIYVNGVSDVTSLLISTDGENYSTDTIQIANNQVARAIAANIEVSINA